METPKPKLLSTDDVILDICGECDADPETQCLCNVTKCKGFQLLLLSWFYEEGKISNDTFRELASEDNLQYIIEDGDEDQSK